MLFTVNIENALNQLPLYQKMRRNQERMLEKKGGLLVAMTAVKRLYVLAIGKIWGDKNKQSEALILIGAHSVSIFEKEYVKLTFSRMNDYGATIDNFYLKPESAIKLAIDLSQNSNFIICHLREK